MVYQSNTGMSSASTVVSTPENSGFDKVQNGPKKVYYTYDQIHQLIDSKANSMTDFDYIIAIGGGGLIPARMLRKTLKIPIIVITIKYYDSDDNVNSEPEIHQWDADLSKKLASKRCLIVDEVFDTGSTMEYVVNRFIKEGVTDLSVMVLHHKKKESNLERFTSIRSHLKNFYPVVEVVDEWIVYPWEADDIIEHNSLAKLN